MLEKGVGSVRLHSEPEPELDAGARWRNDGDESDGDDESDSVAAVSPQAHGVACQASSPGDQARRAPGSGL